jgi:hypothetical protein
MCQGRVRRWRHVLRLVLAERLWLLDSGEHHDHRRVDAARHHTIHPRLGLTRTSSRPHRRQTVSIYSWAITKSCRSSSKTHSKYRARIRLLLELAGRPSSVTPFHALPEALMESIRAISRREWPSAADLDYADRWLRRSGLLRSSRVEEEHSGARRRLIKTAERDVRRDAESFWPIWLISPAIQFLNIAHLGRGRVRSPAVGRQGARQSRAKGRTRAGHSVSAVRGERRRLLGIGQRVSVFSASHILIRD